MEVHEHAFLERRLAVTDANTIIMAIQAMNKCLDGGFIEVTEVGGGLAGFLAQHEGLRVDEAEGVDDDFAFDGLDGVDDDGDGAGGELFEGLLGVDVDAGEPAAEAGVGVVPAYDGFGSEVCELICCRLEVVYGCVPIRLP